MSKVIGKFEFENVTKDFVSDYEYGLLHLLPTIEYRHKYWYMWEFEFIFWKWWKKIQITRTDWDKETNKNEKSME